MSFKLTKGKILGLFLSSPLIVGALTGVFTPLQTDATNNGVIETEVVEQTSPTPSAQVAPDILDETDVLSVPEVQKESVEITEEPAPVPSVVPDDTLKVQPNTKQDVPDPKPEAKAVAVPASPNGTYSNVYGNEVPRPYEAPSIPAGASARCRDGSYSFSQSGRGTCSHHGGVAEWY